MTKRELLSWDFPGASVLVSTILGYVYKNMTCMALHTLSWSTVLTWVPLALLFCSLFWGCMEASSFLFRITSFLSYLTVLLFTPLCCVRLNNSSNVPSGLSAPNMRCQHGNNAWKKNCPLRQSVKIFTKTAGKARSASHCNLILHGPFSWTSWWNSMPWNSTGVNSWVICVLHVGYFDNYGFDRYWFVLYMYIYIYIYIFFFL